MRLRADVAARDAKGKTALDYAVEKQREPAVLRLLGAGLSEDRAVEDRSALLDRTPPTTQSAMEGGRSSVYLRNRVLL